MGKIKDIAKRYSTTLLLLLCIVCFMFIVYVIKQQSNKPIKEQIDDKPVFDLSMSILKNQNDSLIKKVKLLDTQIEKMKADIDSLDKIKSKIKIKYDAKIKEINNASNLRIYTELKSILAKDSIR